MRRNNLLRSPDGYPTSLAYNEQTKFSFPIYLYKIPSFLAMKKFSPPGFSAGDLQFICWAGIDEALQSVLAQNDGESWLANHFFGCQQRPASAKSAVRPRSGALLGLVDGVS